MKKAKNPHIWEKPERKVDFKVKIDNGLKAALNDLEEYALSLQKKLKIKAPTN